MSKKICPHCFKEIDFYATKCPYCTGDIEREPASGKKGTRGELLFSLVLIFVGYCMCSIPLFPALGGLIIGVGLVGIFMFVASYL